MNIFLIVRGFVARSAFAAALMLSTGPLFVIGPTGAAAQTQTGAPNADPVRALLSQYGNFVQHPRYGEAWLPTAVPQGWHPYPPCHWVNTKQYGWYYNDETPWGQVVHHYGRWANDPQMGWIWISGPEFSPAWVVWRTGRQWIGWEPLMPDADLQPGAPQPPSASWIFMETQKFDAGCTGAGQQIAPTANIPVILGQTHFVTNVEYVDGIAVYVLPPAFQGPIVDISLNFAPWAPAFFAQFIINNNWLWKNLVLPGNANYCVP